MTSRLTHPAPKPDFLVIGSMKCATSTVATYLEAHPDVGMVKGPDPRYFSRDSHYAKGADWYGRFFEGLGDHMVMGEGTNDYAAGALYPATAGRVAADLPDVKLIFMVRHPLKRISSAWTQYRADSGDFVPPTLDAAVLEKPDYLVDQSLYWKNLQRYRAHFDDSQIFVGFLEDLTSEGDAFWARLCDFLGVPAAPFQQPIHTNPSRGKRVPSETYSRLKTLAVLKPIRALLPYGLKRHLRKTVFSQPAQQLAKFSPEMKAQLEDVLRPDAEALLAHCNRPADFWDLGQGRP